MNKIFFSTLAAVVLLIGCTQKFSADEIKSADITGFVSACVKFEAEYPDFLKYITKKTVTDSSKYEYDYVMEVLKADGFDDPDFFCAVYNAVLPVIDAIKKNMDDNFYQTAQVSNVKFLEESEKKFTQKLADTTLSEKKRKDYNESLRQIIQTRNELLIQSGKNKDFIDKVRKDAAGETYIVLTDDQIMTLAVMVMQSVEKK